MASATRAAAAGVRVARRGPDPGGRGKRGNAGSGGRFRLRALPVPPRRRGRGAASGRDARRSSTKRDPATPSTPLSLPFHLFPLPPGSGPLLATRTPAAAARVADAIHPSLFPLLAALLQ